MGRPEYLKSARGMQQLLIHLDSVIDLSVPALGKSGTPEPGIVLLLKTASGIKMNSSGFTAC